jgi:hypothetical protein
MPPFICALNHSCASSRFLAGDEKLVLSDDLEPSEREETKGVPSGPPFKARKKNLRFSSRGLSFPCMESLQAGRACLRDFFY